VPRGAADMSLLRSIVIAVDGLAAVLLYFAVTRSGASPMSGGVAAVLYHTVPLEYRIATVGNLTNAFSQSLAAAAFAFMVAWPGRSQAAGAALIAITLVFAFLSHTSTFAIGSVAAALIALLLYVRGGSKLKEAATAIGLAAVAAILGATLLYYAHFLDVYRSEWARISVETATAAPDAGGRGIAERLSSVPRYLYLYLGPPLLILAAWGGTMLPAAPARRMALVVGGWVLACTLFLVLGIVTPVDMRHYLAVIPALAVAGGVAVAQGYGSGRLERALAVALLGWAVAIFLHTWWTTLP
jgi:hypothetical protein